MAAINIIQHCNSIPEKSQRKADNDQAATSPNHLFLLVVVFPSGYHAELHLGQKIKGGCGGGEVILKVTGKENWRIYNINKK